MTMLEKLTRTYDRTLGWGNGGFGIGYYANEDEKVPKRFEFEEGVFELLLQRENFFNWHYKPNDYPEHLEQLTRRVTAPQELRLAFFASGRGSNVDAILENIESGELDASPKIIFTNRNDAGVINVADKRKLPLLIANKRIYKDHCDDIILGLLRDFDVNCIVLAGYLKKISPKFIDAYPGHILNIHPSLLPKYGGKGMYGSRVHQAVLDAGDAVSGPSVHVVTEGYNEGQLLGQRIVEVTEEDTIKSLSSRILHAEHKLFTNVLIEIQQGRILL